MKLNCDLGEFEEESESSIDKQVMPLIDMANIACGFHASNHRVMSRVLELVAEYGVLLGAHPGFPDRENFGRKHLELKPQEITELVAYQIGALSGLAALHGLSVQYVKPHGALYHAMMKEEAVFRSILRAVEVQPSVSQLMILSSLKNEDYENIAHESGVKLLLEGFADRAYGEDGMLVPRDRAGAMITDLENVRSQIENFKAGRVKSAGGQVLELQVDSICVHGDTPNALALIQSIRSWL